MLCLATSDIKRKWTRPISNGPQVLNPLVNRWILLLSPTSEVVARACPVLDNSLISWLIGQPQQTVPVPVAANGSPFGDKMHRGLSDIASILRRTGSRWSERLKRPPRIRRLPASLDIHIRDFFLEQKHPLVSRYEYLFRYFLTGFLSYSLPCYSRAYYPGAPSNSGAALDSLEGFSRIAPLLASWLYRGRPSVVSPLTDSPPVDLRHILMQGLIHGTDPHSRCYWGPIADYDGRIVEAPDIALTLWLLRNTVWPELTPRQQEQVIQWLKPIGRRLVHDNNWHLFPVLVEQVLQALGHEPVAADHHYARLKSFYAGDGWFTDGPGGVYDYYNAWGIHYALFWIDQVNPSYDNEFILTALNQFVANFHAALLLNSLARNGHKPTISTRHSPLTTTHTTIGACRALLTILVNARVSRGLIYGTNNLAY